MAQMSLFDTVKDDDIIEEIKESGYDTSDTYGSNEYHCINLQNKIKNRW